MSPPTDAVRSDAPIFVVGSPRSGTSLLRDLLRSHPSLAFPGESHFIPLLYRAYGDPGTDRAARALARRIAAIRWVRDWDVRLDVASMARQRSFAAMVAGIYEQMARREGKPRWGDKSPPYVKDIPVLLELFPRAKVVHIHRDGRDVALSWLAAPFGPRNLLAAAHAWRRMVAAGRRDGARFPDSYLEVRYEGLLERPEQELRRICELIGEPFVEDVLRPSFLPPSPRAPIVGGRAHPTPRAETRIASPGAGWRERMQPGERALFESVAGDLLGSLGYEVEGLARPISRRERLGSAAHSRAGLLMHRLNTRDNDLRSFLVMEEARLRLRARAARRRGAPLTARRS